MTHLNQHEVVSVPCKNPGCGQIVTAPRWHNKEYCTSRCRKMARRQREKEQVVSQVEPKTPNEITNPTTGQLDILAQCYLQGALRDPTIFKGNVPMWEPPIGIGFAKDIGTGNWIMCI